MTWGKELPPAPLSITLLDDLIIKSSGIRDFAIDGKLPKNRRTLYVKYPKSFQATLVQIGKEGHQAFMTADANMEKINLLMRDFRDTMRGATAILQIGDKNVSSVVLPVSVSEIRYAVRTSTALSKAVVRQFENVMNLTMEVLEMCASENIVQENKMQNSTDRPKASSLTMLSNQETVIQPNATTVRDTATITRGVEDMRKALKELPNEWKMLGIDFVQRMDGILTLSLSNVSHGGGKIVANLGDDPKEAVISYNGSSSIPPNSNGSSIVGEGGWSSMNQDPCIVQLKKKNSGVGALANLSKSFEDLSSVNWPTLDPNDFNEDSEKFNETLFNFNKCKPVANVANLYFEFIAKMAALSDATQPSNATEFEFIESLAFDFFQVLGLVEQLQSATSHLK